MYVKRVLIVIIAVIILISCVIIRFPLWFVKNRDLKENMEYIPQGEFILGSNGSEFKNGEDSGRWGKDFFKNESPQQVIKLYDFYIDKFEVTNKEFKIFVERNGYQSSSNWQKEYKGDSMDRHPVSGVSWFDAENYCLWKGKRLPTEIEWEKAARGPNGNKYPWGNTFNIKNGNLNKGRTFPVGIFEADKSFYDVYDMGGNVMEWTRSWYRPYKGSMFNSSDYGEKYRVLRGGTGTTVGHYAMPNIFSRSSYRHYDTPFSTTTDTGFRCVMSSMEK